MTGELVAISLPLRHTSSTGISWLPPRLRASRFQLLSLLLILSSMVISLAYVVFLYPLDLASDEAHYWDWSRQLDWCYYSKGPVIAWLIRASCECLGRASIQLTGDLAAAIRLPAIACHGVILSASYLLAAGVFRSPRVGLAVIAAEVTLPGLRVGSVLMTIDPPFLACWSWALVGVWKAAAVEHPNRDTAWWVCAGGCTALGILTKFTMALFPVMVLAFLLRHQRSAFRRPGVWCFLTASLLAWIPILVWNARHDWVSFRHVLGQVGSDHLVGARLHWYGPALYLGAQAGTLFGGWLLAFLAAGWRFRPSQENDPGICLLWWCSVPVWLCFAIASILKYGQPNWPAPAYIGGFILTAVLVYEQFAGSRRRTVRWCLIATIATSLVATVFILFPGTIRPVLASCVGRPTAEKPVPVRALDISARLFGWKTLAREVDQVRTRIMKESGAAPVLAATHWTIPGHLRFYCDDNPEVFSVGIANRSDRHSQYDLWRPNPVADAQVFQGRTFVIVGDLGQTVRTCFDFIEPEIRVTHTEHDIPVAAWSVWVCHGFRGFAEANAGSFDAGY